ncbi:MAG TPA: hypothetical protein VNZ22_15250, partial [Bacillota bacterium]|nr:hypothetical protein [Bacillota bacterium]
RCVQKFDADRTAFVRNTFQRDAAAPLNYDLVINTGEMSLEAAAEMVMVGLKRKLSVALPRQHATALSA